MTSTEHPSLKPSEAPSIFNPTTAPTEILIETAWYVGTCLRRGSWLNGHGTGAALTSTTRPALEDLGATIEAELRRRDVAAPMAWVVR